MSKEFLIRDASNADGPAVIALIDEVYREYGDVICLDGADSDLLDLEASYAGKGGAFVVMESDGAIVGSHAVDPSITGDGLCTFRRLYLKRDVRGSGAGDQLMQWAFDWAREAGLRRVEFWSDVRFERAHRFFRRLGFQSNGMIRDMNDGAMPYREFFFWRDL